MWNCVDDKNDNEEGRAPLEYLPRDPRFSSYATVYTSIIEAYLVSVETVCLSVCLSHARIIRKPALVSRMVVIDGWPAPRRLALPLPDKVRPQIRNGLLRLRASNEWSTEKCKSSAF